MKALIFVYAPTSFRIGGDHPLKQLQFGNMKFADCPTVSRPPAGDYQLAGGVYMVYTEADDVHPDVTATSGTRGTHYEIIDLASKDKWPIPPSLGSMATMSGEDYQELVEGIRIKMQQVFENQLIEFTASLTK